MHITNIIAGRTKVPDQFAPGIGAEVLKKFWVIGWRS